MVTWAYAHFAVTLLVIGCSLPQHTLPPPTVTRRSPQTLATTPLASPPPPEPPTAPLSVTTFGPQGPISVGATAADGHWMVICDDLSAPVPSARLYIENKPLIALTALLATSADERYLVVAEQDRWLLLDTRSDYRLDLTANGIARTLVPGENQAVSLSIHPSLPQLAVIVENALGQRLSLFDISQNRVTHLAALPNAIYRVRWAPAGDALYLDELAPSLGKRLRVDSRDPSTTNSNYLCRTPEPRFLAYTPRLRPLTTYVVEPNAQKLVERTGELLRTARGAFVRTASQRLVLQSGERVVPLSPDGCETNVLGQHVDTSTLLVGCARSGRMRLGLVTSEGYYPLDIESPAVYDLDDRVLTAKYLPIYVGSNSYLVDFGKRRKIALKDRDQLLAQKDDVVLLKREHSVYRRDLVSGEEQLVVDELSPSARLLFAPGVVYVAPYVITVGPVQQKPRRAPSGVLALRRDGCALVATSPADPPNYAQGPLYWDCDVGNRVPPKASVSAFSSARTDVNR